MKKILRKQVIKVLLLMLVASGLLLTQNSFAEEPKKEAPEQEVVKQEMPVCFDCRIKELTAEFEKNKKILEQSYGAIKQLEARQERIRGAVEELQKLSPKVEKKTEAKK